MYSFGNYFSLNSLETNLQAGSSSRFLSEINTKINTKVSKTKRVHKFYCTSFRGQRDFGALFLDICYCSNKKSHLIAINCSQSC